jgi:hypothetical protein
MATTRRVREGAAGFGAEVDVTVSSYEGPPDGSLREVV